MNNNCHISEPNDGAQTGYAYHLCATFRTVRDIVLGFLNLVV